MQRQCRNINTAVQFGADLCPPGRPRLRIRTTGYNLAMVHTLLMETRFGDVDLINVGIAIPDLF